MWENMSRQLNIFNKDRYLFLVDNSKNNNLIDCAINMSNIIGRPTIINTIIVKKLQKAFELGLNVTEACNYAEISRQTFYYNFENSIDFFDKMQRAIFTPKMNALEVVRKAISKGDVSTAKWYLEKKHSKEFGIKAQPDEITVTAIKQENTISVFKEIIEEIKVLNSKR